MQGDELLTNIFFVTVDAKCYYFAASSSVLGMNGSKVPSHKGKEIRLFKELEVFI